MSIHEYVKSQEISLEDYPFYALIMAAMRQADDANLMRLQREFPEQWGELRERYNTPGGVFNDDELIWHERYYADKHRRNDDGS
ncbi:MAG: hypothetical protein DRQ39_04430 [Gammaproteobacteria bacterium]|nr:MAG: hypothetical protein DRQ39_04430 [Gammaproteobacteria bacterium]